MARADVFRLRADDPVGAALLERMCDPAAGPADGERRREQRRWQAEAVQQQRRVELDIGLQAPARLVLLEETQRVRLDQSPGRVIVRANAEGTEKTVAFQIAVSSPPG